MQCVLYVSLQGENIDPKKFQTHASDLIEGEVLRRRHSGEPLVKVPRDYWASTKINAAPEEITTNLLVLLDKIVPVLLSYPERAGLQAIAHVVLYFEEGEKPTGLNF